MGTKEKEMNGPDISLTQCRKDRTFIGVVVCISIAVGLMSFTMGMKVGSNKKDPLAALSNEQKSAILTFDQGYCHAYIELSGEIVRSDHSSNKVYSFINEKLKEIIKRQQALGLLPEGADEEVPSCESMGSIRE
jgi:hypothetical protein